MHGVHMYLAVICHLKVWQKDRDLFHTAVVTQGCNRYQNESQHRKLKLHSKQTVLCQMFVLTCILDIGQKSSYGRSTDIPFMRLRILWHV